MAARCRRRWAAQTVSRVGDSIHYVALVIFVLDSEQFRCVGQRRGDLRGAPDRAVGSLRWHRISDLYLLMIATAHSTTAIAAVVACITSAGFGTGSGPPSAARRSRARVDVKVETPRTTVTASRLLLIHAVVGDCTTAKTIQKKTAVTAAVT